MRTNNATGASLLTSPRPLISKTRELYAKDTAVGDLTQTIYALDSTTIDLCLELFPWAKFHRTKAAVKLHTLIDVRG